jgi:hypothetical protein
MPESIHKTEMRMVSLALGLGNHSHAPEKWKKQPNLRVFLTIISICEWFPIARVPESIHKTEMRMVSLA